MNYTTNSSPAILPYFDAVLSGLDRKDPETTMAFGRHVHWGYWTDPSRAIGTASDYGHAAEQLCQRVCDAAQIHDGLDVLDVGCGIGGTIASLNDRFSNLNLVGVNIDRRQLDRAARTIEPKNGNKIEFIEADAGDLPFVAGSFDAILAVECIFHFPDRLAFFEEVSRALRPAGRLALSDFIPDLDILHLIEEFEFGRDEATRITYGEIDVRCSERHYEEMGRATGLTLLEHDDVTGNTLPTYTFLNHYLRTWNNPALYQKATRQLEKACRKRWLRYAILQFRKLDPSAHSRPRG